MFGAIIGDIVGSIYEFHNIKTKDFVLFSDKCYFTDDSVMTIAVAKALTEFFSKNNKETLPNLTIKDMQELGQRYPGRGYGGRFAYWLWESDPKPYNSYGNGAAMRICPAAEITNDLDKALALAEDVTAVTHNHPEGIKGAKATVHAIFLAREKRNLEDIKKIIKEEYYPQMDDTFTLDNIRKDYYFNETCQETVPQAIQAFVESASFEDAIRNAISLGGDSDTLACITGSIAEAYYGVPKELREKVITYLDDYLMAIIQNFEKIQCQ